MVWMWAIGPKMRVNGQEGFVALISIYEDIMTRKTHSFHRREDFGLPLL
jgi:hypothetical protein